MDSRMQQPSPGRLFTAPLDVVNIGLPGFANELAGLGVPVVHLDWSPPAGGDPELAALLARLASDPAIEAANATAVQRMLEAEPVLIDVVPAAEAIPAPRRRPHHSARRPAHRWERMCGPLRGAICGAIVFEGWAESLDAAEKLAARGGVRLRPNHDFDAVGPMTGLTTRSMPVLVVENRKFGNRAYCHDQRGAGQGDALRRQRRRGAPAPGVAAR